MQDEFIKLGGYEVNTKVDKLVSAFKIEGLMDKNYILLSGGEKTIVSLVSVLLLEPDILMLDEPTNHLDIEMMEYLEHFLANYDKTVLIISHDRYFINKLANKIAIIDNFSIKTYLGNYDDSKTIVIKQNMC